MQNVENGSNRNPADFYATPISAHQRRAFIDGVLGMTLGENVQSVLQGVDPTAAAGRLAMLQYAATAQAARELASMAPDWAAKIVEQRL